jgi:hypothetical protein
MVKKKKVFPSTIKYRESHPAIAFRLKKVDKIKLDAIIKATGKPLSKWMTDFIHKKMAPYEEPSKLVARIKVLEEKNKELATEERFTVPCSICGKPMNMSSKHSNWKTKIDPILKEKFSTWYHTACKSSKSPAQ